VVYSPNCQTCMFCCIGITGYLYCHRSPSNSPCWQWKESQQSGYFLSVVEGSKFWRAIDAWSSCCYVAGCGGWLLRCLNLEIMTTLNRTEQNSLGKMGALQKHSTKNRKNLVKPTSFDFQHPP
jgi:hypothetical protein